MLLEFIEISGLSVNWIIRTCRCLWLTLRNCLKSLESKGYLSVGYHQLQLSPSLYESAIFECHGIARVQQPFSEFSKQAMSHLKMRRSVQFHKRNHFHSFLCHRDITRAVENHKKAEQSPEWLLFSPVSQPDRDTSKNKQILPTSSTTFVA